MKAVLISIQPKWCEFIASGKKTVEVRKTKPNIETPFKCYIYCTKGKHKGDFITKSEKFGYLTGHEGSFYNRAKEYDANGKVIGEFVCDRIAEYECSSYGFGELATTCGTCLTYDEILNYCNGNDLYGWHITDLVIYDKPKELGEFRKICQSDYCHTCDYAVKKNGYLVDCDRSVKRPPQSWCYCEEILQPLVEQKGKTITITRWRYNEHKGETE